jgi:hypothetical protein
VSFGEPANDLGFAPCTKPAASYVSWSDTEIVVTVPSMSPGKSGHPHTYHPVYVTKGGVATNRYNFFITPAYTVTTRTITETRDGGLWIGDYLDTYHNGQPCHDVLFDTVTFNSTNPDIGGNAGGVLTVGQDGLTYNITFLDCYINGNTGPGGTDDEGVNAIKGVAIGLDGLHDITFAGCYTEECSRMAIEWTAATASYSHYNLAVRDCEFEPVGEEAGSFVGSHETTFAAYILIDSCTFRGYDNKADFGWYGGFEIQGIRYCEVRNCTFLGGGQKWGNCGGYSGETGHCYWLFDNVTVDFRTYDDLQTIEDANGFGVFGNRGASSWVNYSLFKDCHFYAHPQDTTWGLAFGGDYNDLSTSTVHGLGSNYIDFDGTGNVAPIHV